MKKPRAVLVLLTVALAPVFWTSCSKDATPVSTTSSTVDIRPVKTICPLAVGNYWVYDDLIYDSYGNVSDVDSSKLGLGCSLNLSDGSNAYTAYLWSWYAVYETLSTSENGWPMAITDEGLCNIGYNDSTFVECIVAKYPCTAGETWCSNGAVEYYPYNGSYYYHSYTDSYECISTRQPFECGLGVLYCIMHRYSITFKNKILLNHLQQFGIDADKLSFDGKTTYVVDLYFALNVGYVGHEITADGNIFYKKVLKRFHKQ